MAAITNYTTLAAAIDDWDDRDQDADEIIGLAEADFRLYLGPNFAIETAAATVVFTAGTGALPAGFIRPISLTIASYGEVTFTGLGAVKQANIFAGSGTPGLAAISGSSIYTAPLYTGNGTFAYEGSLTGLSGSNATNWLITNAPQAYLAMCLHYAKAKFEDPTAPTYRAAALQTLNDLGIQSMVAQQARASVTIPGPTP